MAHVIRRGQKKEDSGYNIKAEKGAAVLMIRKTSTATLSFCMPTTRGMVISSFSPGAYFSEMFSPFPLNVISGISVAEVYVGAQSGIAELRAAS